MVGFPIEHLHVMLTRSKQVTAESSDTSEETLTLRRHDTGMPESRTRDFPSVCVFLCNVAGTRQRAVEQHSAQSVQSGTAEELMGKAGAVVGATLQCHRGRKRDGESLFPRLDP
ncbi:unnamed protein product [Pleuronectes platessa]|uniref:Uncharacterized protein n=1 Tax=Pleuronectes platessa TaxID=8262 RepID=A0A9N7UVZ8_PLEPL|nr:unnamed protein product [Pleuronectes platessa]